MGIKNYCKWINTLDCKLSTDDNFKYDNIYIDMNHILYLCVNASNDLQGFFQDLEARINNIIKNYMAKKNYVFCFDGPAAYSKIILQKKRRMREIQTIINDNDELDNCEINDSSSSCSTNYTDDTNNNTNNTNFDDLNTVESKGSISFLSLTPGTPFMDNVMNYFKKLMENIFSKFKYLKCTHKILTSNLPDEGEIKVFNELQKNAKLCPEDTHLVIGNDADLIVLAVAINIKSINVLTKYQSNYVLYSVDKFVDIIIRDYLHIDVQRFNNKDKLIYDLRNDISLLSLMLGNDYLPKVKLVTLNNIWSVYGTCFECLVSVNIENMSILYEYETCFKNNKINHDFLIKYFGTFMKLKKTKYGLKDYVKKSEIIKSYVDGILWCHNIYSQGFVREYDYVYEGEMLLIPDLYYYFLLTKQHIKNEDILSMPPPINIYPLIVLPYKAKNLIYKEQQELMDTTYNYLYEVENCSECANFNTSMKEIKKRLSTTTTELNKKKLIYKNNNNDKTKNNIIFQEKKIKKIKLEQRKIITNYNNHRNTTHINVNTFNKETINNIISKYKSLNKT